MADIDKVVKSALQQGWRHSTTTKGHHQFMSPDRETIIHTSGTPSDWRSWHNFMSRMEKAGFQMNGQLGDALKAALGQDKVPEEAVVVDSVQTGPAVSALVEDYFLGHPMKIMSCETLVETLGVRYPYVKNGAVQQGIKRLADKGTIQKYSRGHYRYVPNVHTKAEEPVVPALPSASVTPTPPTPSPVAIGVMTGDEVLDEDLKIMDNALAALSQLSEVVARQRARLMKFAELKKMLGG